MLPLFKDQDILLCCYSSLWFLLLSSWKSNANFSSLKPGVKLLCASTHTTPHPPFVEMSGAGPSSGFAGSVDNGTFLELFPTSLSTSVDPSSGHLSNVYIYVSIFLSLLAFLLLLLIIALQRLKNIISSSSSYPEYPSDAGSSFTNLEVCSISSQRSTFSNLSSWRKWKDRLSEHSFGFSMQKELLPDRNDCSGWPVFGFHFLFLFCSGCVPFMRGGASADRNVGKGWSVGFCPKFLANIEAGQLCAGRHGLSCGLLEMLVRSSSTLPLPKPWD